jgi:predicted transcriptional regulator
MKTAVSIPDDLFERAEELAEYRGVSRSDLYTAALRQYVDRERGDWVTSQINEVCDEMDSETDKFVEEAARRTLREQSW